MRLGTILNIFILLALVGGFYFFFSDKIQVVASQAMQQVLPCSRPITYRIATIDKNFGISQKQIIDDLAAASKIWNTASGKELFAYDPKGVVVVNLVYDNRQATTQQLKSLGLAVSDDKVSYDVVKAKYDSIFSDFQQKKRAFEADVATFEAKQNAYNAEVEGWNARGGAPRDVYAHLEVEKAALTAESRRLQEVQNSLNTEAGNVNTLARELNHLIQVLNLAVSKYNNTGAQTGDEFEEAVFVRSLGNEEIDVFEYDSNARLIRVLAHELGHALGLEHVNDPKAIMYKLNQSTNDKPAAADIDELRSLCRLK